MKIKDLKKKTLILFIAAILVRIIATLVLGRLYNIHFYEYEVIAQNIINGNGFAFFSNPANSTQFAKGAYMPVGAVLYTVPFFLIQNEVFRTALYLLCNHIMAGLSVILIYKAATNQFNEKVGLYSALIAAFLPEFVFTSSTAMTTNFYHLFVAYLLYFFSLKQEITRKRLLQMAAACGISLLFRGEVALMIVLIAGFIVKKVGYKNALIFTIVAFAFQVPWAVRNYIVLDKFVPITTNFGINLYRGHNPLFPGAWADDRMDSLKVNLKYTDRYELDYVELHKQEAIRYLKQEPFSVISSSFTKMFNLWVYYPYSEDSFHPLYLGPWAIMLMLSIYGVIKARINKIKYFSLIYIMVGYHCVIGIIFFVIPRYQTMMKYWLIPIVAYAIYQIYDLKIKKRNG